MVRIDDKQLPPILAQAGAEAWRHVAEYFTAHIRNPNTRAAYGRAVISFFWWCEALDRHSLRELRPLDIAAYVEEMATHRAAPTVKQHLAAIRMLFDWLVVRQVLPMNPAAAVRGPRPRSPRLGLSGKMTTIGEVMRRGCAIDDCDGLRR